MALEYDLGKLLAQLNPYTNRKQTPNDPDSRKVGEMDIYCRKPPKDGKAPTDGTLDDIELEMEGPYQHEWTFRGQPRRVGMAVRIRYRFPIMNEKGDVLHWAEDYLLIGFEGAMGG
jgi:hypothetical protein